MSVLHAFRYAQLSLVDEDQDRWNNLLALPEQDLAAYRVLFLQALGRFECCVSRNALKVGQLQQDAEKLLNLSLAVLFHNPLYYSLLNECEVTKLTFD